MARVLHIVPYDGIGGVESAARSMSSRPASGLKFEVDYITEDFAPGSFLSTFSPIALLSAAWRASRSDVDLVIVSLWRSSIVGLLAKVIRPRLKLVTFLHNSKDMHFLDFFFTRSSVLLSDEIWADSQSTLDTRTIRWGSKKKRVISFVTQRLQQSPLRPPTASFIFWGRLNPQKGLERALGIFAAIHRLRSEAQFLIIGPDGGALRTLRQVCERSGIQHAVKFAGPLSMDEIARHAQSASFYLQTSLYEGMAMSVVEAMQLGVVPVVTAVGEIGSYCVDGHNSILVDSEEKAVEDVVDLLAQPDRYVSVRFNAISRWEGSALYSDSVLSACRELLQDSAALHKDEY